MKTDKTTHKRSESANVSEERKAEKRGEKKGESDFDSVLERAGKKEKRGAKKKGHPDKKDPSADKKASKQKSSSPSDGSESGRRLSDKPAARDPGSKQRPGETGDVRDELWSGRVRDGEAQVDDRESRLQQRGRQLDGERHRDRGGKDLRQTERREKRGDERRQTTDKPKSDVSPSAADDAPDSIHGARSRGQEPDSVDVGRRAAPIEGATQQSSVEKSQTASAARTDEVAQIADRIVESARVGWDEEGRKMMEMTIDVPGRGRVDVTLKKRGRRFDVDMTPDSPALERQLRRGRKELKNRASQGGVRLGSVRVNHS